MFQVTGSFTSESNLTSLASNRSGIIFSSLPHAIRVKFAGFHVFDSLRVAKTHALRISVTQIAFEKSAALRIPPHGSEWTGRDAHLATDAELMLNADAIQLFIAANSIFRADCHAGRIFTLLTAHRGYKRLNFPI